MKLRILAQSKQEKQENLQPQEKQTEVAKADLQMCSVFTAGAAWRLACCP